MDKIKVYGLKGLAETLLLPLYYKSVLSQEKDPILVDKESVNIIDRIDYDFSKIKVNKKLLTGIASRTYIIDTIIKEWIDKNPGGLIINVGAGLDTRPFTFQEAEWYNVDLPEAIKLRKKLISVEETNLSGDAFDCSWIGEIPQKENVFILCEAMLMFFSEEKVKSFMINIASSFTNSITVFDVVPQIMLDNAKMLGNSLGWGNVALENIVNWHSNMEVLNSYPLPDCFPDRWEEAYGKNNSLINHFKEGFRVNSIWIGNEHSN